MSGDSSQIRVIIGDDRMCASVALAPGLDALTSSAIAVHAALDERGVASSPERAKAVDELVARYTAEIGCQGVVARGVPPAQGSHGRVELMPTFEAGDAKPAGEIPADHYARTSYVTVSPGERIGIVHPCTPGTDGVDVMGRQLLSRAVVDAPLTLDHTIERRPGGELVALAAGVLHRSGSLIRVSDTLEIEKYVDFSTGNLDFPGHIDVARGVRDCFEVRCTGSLHVAGLVEAATLHAQLDAALDIGMAGREKGTLRVGRDLVAKYLEGVDATIGRDATVSTEITNSTVHVGRNLVAPHATIIGGSIDVRGRAEVGQLGSEAAVATDIVIGHDTSLELGLLKGLSLRAALVERAGVLRAKIDTLRKAGGRKNAPAAEEVTGLEYELDGASTKINALRSILTRTLGMLDSFVDGRLVVQAGIHPGVKIWLGCFQIEPRDLVRGPISLTIDPDGKLRVTREGQDESAKFRISHADRFPDREILRRDLAA